jgi:uncharacterized iron-regulated membrane protein
MFNIRHDEALCSALGSRLVGDRDAVAGYISLPRKGPWRKMLSIKWAGIRYRPGFDIHRASGVVLIAVFLMMAVSGAYWMLDFGGTKPVEAAFHAVLPPPVDPVETRATRLVEMDRPTVSYGEAIRLAERELDRQKATYGDIWDLWPNQAKGVIYVEHYLPTGTCGPRGPVVAIDADSGAVVATYLTPETQRAGTNVADWMYALHSGKIIGRRSHIADAQRDSSKDGLILSGARV